MQSKISDKNLKKYFKLANKLALEAGQIMVKYENYKKKLPRNHKYVNEFVAEIIERHIEKSLKKEFPNHSLFKKSNTNNDFEWICDYIDGAYAYSKGHRISVTSVALTYKNETVASAVYNPWTKTLYSAIKNNGFYIDGKLQKNMKMEKYSGTLVNVEWWPNATFDVDTWLHKFSISNDVYVLHIGSIIHSACLVASGSFSAAVLGKFMSGKNHEIAAIKLIIEESGSILTDLDGNEIGHVGNINGLVFANKTIHNDLIKSYENNKK